MNQIIQTLATRTFHAVCAANAHGRISDARSDELNQELATLARMLDKGEIDAHEYKADAMRIARIVGA